MSLAAWTLAVLTLISVDSIAIAYLIEQRTRRNDESWFDHRRFVADKVLADRVREYSRRPVIAHPCSFGGDLLEFPVADGWNEDAILQTLAEIEAL